MVGEETMSEFVTIFNIQQQFHLVYNFAAVPMFLFNLVIFILCILIYMQSKKKPSFAFIGNLSMIDTMMGAMILFLFLVRSDATEGQHERQNVSIHSGHLFQLYQLLLAQGMVGRAGYIGKLKGRGYLPDLFRQIRTYLPELFRQIRTYLTELFRQIKTYLPEVFPANKNLFA